MDRPGVGVVAYNRSKSLRRLLYSLEKAKYSSNVKLIISIDRGGSSDVIRTAKDFEWQYGEKEIISQQKHLGLRKHILQCGDLSQEYEGIVLLEDDLLVSPIFYEYSTRALRYYQNEDRVAGISLYAPLINMFTKLPFIPIIDHSDIYFLQIPASWGEAWSHNQWLEFKNWLKQDKNNEKLKERLPKAVSRWPDSSWAKLFWMYMEKTRKYFVYPRDSLTTQFSEIGVHTPQTTRMYQVPLQLFAGDIRFNSFKDSNVVYDSFYEILPDRLNRLSDQFREYDSFTFDLNGTKELTQINTRLVVTSKKCRNWIKSYGKDLKPLEMNIIEGIEGTDLFLCDKNSIKERRYARFIRHNKDLVFHRDLSKRRLFILLLLKVLRRI